MDRVQCRPRTWAAAALGTVVLSLAGATGCQVQVGGQTLPSAHYLEDDIQYFPPGPKFKLQNEANVQKAFAEEEALRSR